MFTTIKNKVKTIKFAYHLSVFGLIASALAHISTFAGIDLDGVFPLVWILQPLIFIVWLQAIIVSRTKDPQNSRYSFFRVVMRNSPIWMKILCVLLCVYAIFNFLFIFLHEKGVPAVMNGQKAMVEGERIIRVLTDEEYKKHRAYSLRAFSGHWMMFYALGMIVLYSKVKEDSIEEK